jgi:serine/threonine protein kinase
VSAESETLAYQDPDAGSPWAEVVVRLRRATLGEFEIGRELGRGGMAAVFLAHEISLDRKVAIKVMSPGLLMGEGMIERFKREAITIAHLNHPNIVSVYSVRAAEGLHFFVMRAIQGHSLERVIHQAGKLPIPIVLSVLSQVGSALAYAHRFRVVHRDIKPANILIDEDGNAVVTDFGIAKAAESPSHTHTGALVGTPAYMSPEQCNSEEVSGATDQYALGVVAYEMLTGVPPFSGSTYTVIQAHVDRPPAPIRERVAECPPELEAAILRMLAKKPADRFPGMAQALAALGATPLTENDPLRARLSQLATAGSHSRLGADPTPTSPAPRTRRSQVQSDTPTGMLRAITILPPPPALEVGDSFILVARVREGDAARLPRRPVEWSSDAPGVIRISATTAVATAMAPGSAVVTATCEGKMGRLRVDVAPPRADAIVVRPIDKRVRVAEQVQLEATARDKRGHVVSRPVTWTSEDDSVATVDLGGLLTPRSEGSTRITAELDEARASVTVTVHPAEVASLHLSPPPARVAAGDSFSLSATPLDRSGNRLSDRTVLWHVSDVKVAIVTLSGWVMVLHPGPVVLTATCEGASASVSLNVLDRPLKERSSRPAPTASPRVSSGSTSPRGSPPRVERLGTRRRSFSSRRGPLVMTGGALLIAGGLWLAGGRRAAPDAKSPETAAVSQDRTGGHVEPEPGAGGVTTDSGTPASVTITRRPSAPLPPGSSTRLLAEVRDLAGRLVPGASVRWLSTNPAAAVVDSATGRLRAMGAGRAQVIAASGAWRDSVVIAVQSASAQPAGSRSPASLAMSPHPALRVGDTTTMVAVPLDLNGRRIRAPRLSWSSSQPSVAAIDTGTGQLRALAPGTVLISALSGTQSATLELEVLPAAVATVTIEGGRPLKVGDTLALRAAIRDQHGRGIGDRPVAWASRDTTVTVVDSVSGMVRARGAGSSEITATSEGKSGRINITVLPEPRTGRAEEPGMTEAQRVAAPSSEQRAAERQRALEQLGAGVDRCYGALHRKDVVQLAEMYDPVSKSDHDKLKKLSRILRTDEWAAVVGPRVDGRPQIGPAGGAMEFSFLLSWKDAFGGRVKSQTVFRAEYVSRGTQWEMTSCRIVGSPKL